MNESFRTSQSPLIQVENLSPGKTVKIVEYLEHHSTDFHRVFTKMLVMSLAIQILQQMTSTIWVKLKFTQMLIFDTRIFLRINSQRHISLTLIGSQKFQTVSIFGITTVNNNCCFQKVCFILNLTKIDWKSKSVLYLCVWSSFSKMIYILWQRYSFATKKVREAKGSFCKIQFSFSRWKMSCMEKMKQSKILAIFEK